MRAVLPEINLAGSLCLLARRRPGQVTESAFTVRCDVALLTLPQESGAGRIDKVRSVVKLHRRLQLELTRERLLAPMQVRALVLLYLQ